MKIWEVTVPVYTPPDRGSDYVSIHDDGSHAMRRLYIEDDDGNTVVLRDEQIGELYKAIKPALAG